MVKQFCPPQYRIKMKGITTNNLWKPWGQNSWHSFGHNLNDQNIGRIECYAFRLRSANERPDEWGKASHSRPNKSLVFVKHAADDGNPLWLIRTIPAVSTIDGCRMNNEWDFRVCPEQQSNCRTVGKSGWVSRIDPERIQQCNAGKQTGFDSKKGEHGRWLSLMKRDETDARAVRSSVVWTGICSI